MENRDIVREGALWAAARTRIQQMLVDLDGKLPSDSIKTELDSVMEAFKEGANKGAGAMNEIVEGAPRATINDPELAAHIKGLLCMFARSAGVIAGMDFVGAHGKIPDDTAITAADSEFMVAYIVNFELAIAAHLEELSRKL